MHSPVPLTRDLVLIGGGHTHALVLRQWGMAPLPGARLTLINPAPTAPYTGMLPGHVAGHYPRDALQIDLVRLARFAGARLVLGLATGLDRDARQVHVPGRPPIRYDVASIDIGITSEMPALPGFADHGIAAKPLGPFADAWAAFCAAVTAGKAAPDIAVIGGGVAGVELALAMHHRLSALGVAPRLTVIEAATAVPETKPRTRRLLLTRLQRSGIRLIEGDAATEVTATEVRTASGAAVPAAFCVGAAGARPHGWLAELGLAHEAGFLTVDAQLRSVTDPAIHAAGDCAHLGFAPRPKAGVYAVRAAPILTANLRAALAGGARRRFRPQADYLKLISLGARDAVGDRSGVTLSGPWVWRWKDRIDRRFMDRLNDLTPMPPPRLPHPRARGVAEVTGSTPPCAGCGAKLGSGALSAALARLPAPARPDLLSAPGDDAAILRHGSGWQVLSTDHLRAFTEDPVMLARIAAVHALGDIWAMGAAPQAATATLILPRMAPPLAQATVAEIMVAAAEVFRDAGAEIVGGHTSLGAEMTLGFTVTGLAEAAPITLAGARPGDALVLTKPIGSGTVLAAEMRLQAPGEAATATLARMAQPQGTAAQVLAPHAHAMTDVTGFGLAGHLWNICAASGVAAHLDLAAIPVMPGAAALAERGIRSTLWPENRAALDGRLAGQTEGPRAALTFDPQTAGGLLAAVPEAEAARLVDRLQEAGYAAALIGHLGDGAPGLTFG